MQQLWSRAPSVPTHEVQKADVDFALAIATAEKVTVNESTLSSYC